MKLHRNFRETDPWVTMHKRTFVGVVFNHHGLLVWRLSNGKEQEKLIDHLEHKKIQLHLLHASRPWLLKWIITVGHKFPKQTWLSYCTLQCANCLQCLSVRALRTCADQLLPKSVLENSMLFSPHMSMWWRTSQFSPRLVFHISL